MRSLTFVMLFCVLSAPALCQESIRRAQLVGSRFNAVWGPTGDLLRPEQAEKLLNEEEFFEWCQRWNERELAMAFIRATPARRLTGRITESHSYSQGSGSFGYSGYSRAGIARSRTHSRPQEWTLGGYGGGPVTIYNPYAWHLSPAATQGELPVPQKEVTP